MGKGDARRPTAVPDELFEDRWAKAFGTPPALARERPESHNAGSEVFGDRANDDVRLGYALLLGDGYTKIEEKTDE